MERSITSRSSASERHYTSPSQYGHPRWRAPDPMAASLVPPPIVRGPSINVLPPKVLTQSVVVEPSTQLQDQQNELEADLQFLLDAQAQGLTNGFGNGLQDDEASNGSTTPTAQSVRSANVRQQRHLSGRKPGLKSARKGIYSTMLALSSLKRDELADVDDEMRRKEQQLGQIDEWTKKREGLHEASKGVDADEDAIRAQRLRHEAQVLQQEINVAELQLGDLKARHRKLVRQAAAVENSVQAKLSSYTTSLRLLEEDIRHFLSIDPPASNTANLSQEGRASMWQLPAKRRTLEMAKQEWTEEHRSALRLKEGVQHEKAALDEGAAIWKEVVAQITSFERRLRSEMSETSTSSSVSVAEDQSRKLLAVIDSLNQLTLSVERKFELVKTRDWNLLIAAIGAELDALKKGRQMLQSVLHHGHDPNENTDALVGHDFDLEGPSPGEELRDLDKSFERATRRMSNGTDSDPDPELMFSKHGIDTE